MEQNNNDITTPPDELLKRNILFNRDNVLQELKEYLRANEAGIKIPVYKFSAALKTLYFEIATALKKDEEKLYEEARKLIFQNNNVEQKIQAFTILDTWLYKKGVTKFDNIKKSRVY